VTNPFGSGNPSSATFKLLPGITTVDSDNGRIGSTVVIHGTRLDTVTKVTFNGKPAAGFDHDSDTQLSARVPSGATTGKIAVTNANGTTTGPNYTVVGTPTISSFTPAAAPVGASIAVNGTNLLFATVVTFQQEGGGTVDAPVTGTNTATQ